MRGISLDEQTIKRLGLEIGTEADLEHLDIFPGLPYNPRPVGDRFDRALKECKEQFFATETLEPTQPDEYEQGASADDDNNQSPDEDTAKDRIADILDAALGKVRSRPTSSDIAESLTTSVPLGPADVDAYYDYHNLRIAWADTWTAVSDKRMKRRIKRLFNSIVDVVEFDLDELEADYSEIDELHDLLDELEDSVDAAATAHEPVVSSPPPNLAAWMPDLADVWYYISDVDRRFSELQFDLEEYVKSRIPDLVPGVAANSTDLLNEVLDAIAGGIPNLLRILFSKKLWKISPFDDENIRDWVPDMKVVDAVVTIATTPQYFRNRIRDQVNFEDALREKKEDDAQSDNNPAYATHAASRLGRAERLIGELKASLNEPYQFDVFANGSYNFGALITYRQRWRPQSYQVGDLAGTLPLAPNERRSYSVTTKTTTTRTSTHDSSSLSESTREMNKKDRAEAQITDSVKRSMSAATNSSMTLSLDDYLSFTAGSTINTESSADSHRVKKNVREFTDKAVQKYRDENKVSVSIEEGFELSSTESREISNPNNEITVTYLFYELQRRYEVSERFYDLEPVILVAYDMPSPDEITEAWLLKYDWIIRRRLIDESYLPALAYLSQTFAGDEVSVEVLEQQWKNPTRRGFGAQTSSWRS